MFRSLPQRPHLDHLKHEAKALLAAIRAGDAGALARAEAVLGDKGSIRLTDAQRVIAREYGFPTWARLRSHVQASRGLDDAVDAYLGAIQMQNGDEALRIVRAHPRIAEASLHVAATLGRTSDVARLIAEDPSRVSARAGQSPADPLLFLCYSPFFGESAERDAGLIASARALLDAGADPNTRDAQHGVPALYAVTGLRSIPAMARLLLSAGANPTDGESVFHAAERFHEDALELLLDAGADLNERGDWGNTPLYFLLRWWSLDRQPRTAQGVQWLLDHGADPNVPSGDDRENALHVAARRGQPLDVIRSMLEHGADVHARRGDGRTAWFLARRGGFDAIAALLETAGAEPETLAPLDAVMAACARGDAAAVSTPESRALIPELPREDLLLLPEAAGDGRHATVLACLAAGFPVDITDGWGATALHHAVIHGQSEVARTLLAAGASISIRDTEHHATALGWATFGADHVADPGGDYEGCVRALLDAGARPRSGEYRPQQARLRAMLDQVDTT
jgi:ankyrin repeat protein